MLYLCWTFFVVCVFCGKFIGGFEQECERGDRNGMNGTAQATGTGATNHCFCLGRDDGLT